MKTKFITLCIAILIVLSCKQNSEKKSLENVTCEDELKLLKDKLHDLMETHDAVFPTPCCLNNQDVIPVDDYQGRYVIKDRYETSGEINSDTDEIDIIIPITDNQLRIVNAVNISGNEINALLIILKGNGGIKTPTGAATHLIKNKFKISKLGLKPNLSKLMVIVMHDANFNGAHVVSYQRIINNPCTTYEDIKAYINSQEWKIDKSRPGEDGGDIIP